MPGYDCEICEGQESAVMLVTPLTGGNTAALGLNCAPVGLSAILASMVGVDADTLYDTIQKHVNRVQAAAAAEQNGEAAPRARKGRPRSQAAAPDSEREEREAAQ